MNRTIRLVGMLLFALGLATMFLDRAQPAPAAQAVSSADAATRIAALESLIPDQAHIMADVGEHFANLWFAGEAENWPLADFYLSETQSHLRWAVRRIPIRKDNAGREINLNNILQAFENSELKTLKRTVSEKHRPRFEQAYRNSLTICYACHKAADKPFLRPGIPQAPASPIMNFDPHAQWPG